MEKNPFYSLFDPRASGPFLASNYSVPSALLSREAQLAAFLKQEVPPATSAVVCPSLPSHSYVLPTPLYPASAIQARALHLRRGIIGSIVYSELQRRTAEAAEVAALMRLQERHDLGSFRLFDGNSSATEGHVAESFERSASNAFISGSRNETDELTKPRLPDDSERPTGIHLEIRQECKTPKEAAIVLQTLGSTFRTKVDVYIDASRIQDPGLPRSARGGKHVFFPDKLYKCLCDLKVEGKDDIARFLSHGRAFVVSKPDLFEQEVMPRYFESIKKWNSFSRQLYLWGFVRVSSGPDAGAFWHELFLDGHDQLLRYMRRVGAPQEAKEDRRKARHRSGADPDFYAMKPLLRAEPLAKPVLPVALL